MTELRYGQAINKAISHAMAADERVILLGEDVGEAGGPFGVTRDLLTTFGADRVIDTPLSEAAIVGLSVGAAMSGLKPIVEIMFMDFVTFGMDALVNQAAKARFMFGGQLSVPMVLRTPHGGGVNAGPQHSQCLEAWFAHVPGLKVVCPSDATSAYALMHAAIADPDPVIFVEHKRLYAAKSAFDESANHTIGKARILRAGKDVTLVCYGGLVGEALIAGEMLEDEGIATEIIDLLSIQPWDRQCVLDSLRRTHRVVIAHEAVEAFGVGAEIAACLADFGFDDLDAPIVRVGAPFMPSPFSKQLEKQFLPSAAGIVAAIRRVLL